jgi:predicted Zn-dependent peptidase
MNKTKYKLVKLPNGIRALVASSPTSTTEVTLNVLLGSKHETLKELHMTHLAEHILANFTPEVMNNLNNQGAYFNAYTLEYETKFVINGPQIHIGFYLEVLTNAINTFSTTSYNNIDNERMAVIQELQQSMYSKPSYEFDKKISKYMYPNTNHYDYKLNIKKLKKYTPTDMTKYIRTHIIPKNIVVTVMCSQHNISSVVKLVKKYFSLIANNQSSSKHLQTGIFRQKLHKNKSIKILFVKNQQHKDSTNASLRLVITKPIKYGSTRHIGLLYIHHILFNTATGILHRELRSHLGLIYSITMNVSADVIDYIHTGYTIETNTDEKNVGQVCR